MMVGMLLWKEKLPGKREKTVFLRQIRVLNLPILCAEVLWEERIPEALLRRRMHAAAKKLRKAGVKEVLLPENYPAEELPERFGLKSVSTVPLRRMIAADWVRAELDRKQLPPAAARVAVAAPLLTGDVVRTVTELALRHRYVLLDVPQGTEEFRRRLNRQYGISLLDGTDHQQRARAEVLVQFAPEEPQQEKHSAVLRLWDTTQPLPPLLLPPVLEEGFPEGADRGQLLAVLLRGGVLRPGQICVGMAGT